MVNPFVFQCAQCNQIFGDSSSWFVSTPPLAAFTLTNFTIDSLRVQEAISIVPSRQDTEDSGSTYCELLCTGCSTSIGRVYKSTPHKLDHLRDKYTFLTAKTKCYEVGKLDIIPQAVDADIIQATRPTPDDIAKRFAVLEAIVLSLHKRIDSLTPSSTS